MKHPARVTVLHFEYVPGIASAVPVYAQTCADCGRPVRQMYGLGVDRGYGGRGPTFYHSAGKAKPGDARRGPRRAEHSAAIGAGMRAANARRKERFG